MCVTRSTDKGVKICPFKVVAISLSLYLCYASGGFQLPK